MAILSADIRSFTRIAEKMTPDGIFRFLNEYLELVGPIIRSHEGFIAKYEGDGFMALFPKGPEMAVRCAVQMQSAISARNRNTDGGSTINVGIGIDSGRLALGTIGDDSRLDSAVISSCVKGAARIESLTKVYQSRILVNGAVFGGLSDPLSWFVRPVDQVDTGNGTQFLFEIYNNDSNSVRDMKWKTQGELEHALYSWFAGNFEDCRRYITRVLEHFPSDPVAHLYAERLKDQTK
jgi:two-component system sensor histidine kinase ChiS